MNIQKYFFDRMYTHQIKFDITENDFISIYDRINRHYDPQMHRGKFLKLCLMTSKLSLIQFSRLIGVSITDVSLYFEGTEICDLSSEDASKKFSIIFGLPSWMFSGDLSSMIKEQIKIDVILQIQHPKEMYSRLIEYRSTNSYIVIRNKLKIKRKTYQKNNKPLPEQVIYRLKQELDHLTGLVKGQSFEKSLSVVENFQKYIDVNRKEYGCYTIVVSIFIIGKLLNVILAEHIAIGEHAYLIKRVTQVLKVSSSTVYRYLAMAAIPDSIDYLHHGMWKIFVYSLVIAHLRAVTQQDLTISMLLKEYGHILDKMKTYSINEFIDLEAEYRLNRRLQNSSVKPDQDSIKQESQASVQDLETPEIVPEMSNSKDQAQIESDDSESKQVIIQDQNIKLEKTESENDINKFERSKLEELEVEASASESISNQSIEIDQIEDYKPISTTFKSIGYDQLIRSISNLIIMFDDDVDLDNMSKVNINQLNIILYKLDKIKNKMIENISTKNINDQVKDDLTNLKENMQSANIPFQTPNMSIEELGMLSTMKN